MPCARTGPCDGVCPGAFGIVADQLSATFCNPHRERHDSCNLSTADLASDHRSSAQEPGPPCHSHAGASAPPRGLRGARGSRSADRKSTRLNSSHSQISYAVFCLKKKKTHIILREIQHHLSWNHAHHEQQADDTLSHLLALFLYLIHDAPVCLSLLVVRHIHFILH